MSEPLSLGPDSEAVHTHLSLIQDVIRRMAENSRSCKIWSVTLVSAVLVLVARTQNPDHALIAIVPIALFLFVDTYYLSLERRFIGSYNNFVSRLHSGDLMMSELFEVRPAGSVPRDFFASFTSFSIWPFYLLVAATVVFAWNFVF